MRQGAGKAQSGATGSMKTILKTTDTVLLSYACHLLAEAGIAHEVFDANISAVEGSIGAFPRRLMVPDEAVAAARAALAPIGEHLLPPEEG